MGSHLSGSSLSTINPSIELGSDLETADGRICSSNWESCSRQYRATSTRSPLWKQQGRGNTNPQIVGRDLEFQKIQVREKAREYSLIKLLLCHCVPIGWTYGNTRYTICAMNEYANLAKIILRLVLFNQELLKPRCLVFPMSYDPGG